MMFYLGTHMDGWLAQLNVPLFVSNRRLARRKSLPVARSHWALDSGGFSELSLFGEWRTTPDEYIRNVRRYSAEIGRMDWAAIQDYMCEPTMLQKTGLDIIDHQRLTVISYLRLRDTAPEIPWLPVLQGYSVDDYLRCLDMYRKVTDTDYFGVGSVCRRQATDEIGDIITRLHSEGIKMHGFGVKKLGLQLYGRYLHSADSMAWSFDARRERAPSCMIGEHMNCANCPRFALEWRQKVIDILA